MSVTWILVVFIAVVNSIAIVNYIGVCVFVNPEMAAYQELIIIGFCLTVKIRNALCYVVLVDNRLKPTPKLLILDMFKLA